jgi:hypothetical protein
VTDTTHQMPDVPAQNAGLDAGTPKPVPARKRRKKPLPWIWLLGMTVLVIGLAGAALWGISYFDGRETGTVEARVTTFKTKVDYGIRDDSDVGSGVVVNLKAGSTVSASPSQMVGNEQWYQVTTIDGTIGYMPSSVLERFDGAGGEAKVTGGLRSVEVTALVHLRQSPSLSAGIVGTADSGTRLTADGVVESEGERWLRVPLTPDLTAYVVERYTQVGNDRVSEREFDQDAGSVGAGGTVRELTNLFSSPLPDARVLKALRAGESVRVIGQTRSDRWWYVVLLDDGSQGFVMREAVAVSASANRYVYSDGTVAPGPDVRRAQAEMMRRSGGQASQGAGGQSSSGGRERRSGSSSSDASSGGASDGSTGPAIDPSTDTGVSSAPSSDPAPTPAPAPDAPPAPSDDGDTGVIREQ